MQTSTATTPSSKPFAVVTGASSGIGKELAKEFVRRGYDIFLASGSSELSNVRSEIESLGGTVEGAITVDLTTYDGVEELYQTIADLGRDVDAIAINAGFGVGGSFTNETSLEKELELIQLNVTSTVHLAKRVIPSMVSRGSGEILFTGSIAGLAPTPFEAVYGASKAFVNSFSEALRNELKDTGVNVTALLPGATETNFFHRAGMDDTKVGASEKDSPADVAKKAIDALLAHEDKVVGGGLKSKLQGYVSDVIPDTASAQMHRKMSEPGSARK